MIRKRKKKKEEEKSVYTSTNTTTVTGSVILSDSAAIQCMVAVLGTNYTNTVQETYNKYPYYKKTVAKPYTSASYSISQETIIPGIILYTVFKEHSYQRRLLY